MVFRGTYDYSLDAKNRLTVPAKFRHALSDRVVLAKATDPCVVLWPVADYDAYVQATLSNYPPGSADAQVFKRWVSANAFDADLDSAGRVMLPSDLMEHAGLSKEVKLAGAMDSLEIWDRATWTEHNASLTAHVSDLTARLGHTA